MKLNVTTTNGRMVAELEADSQKELFAQVANFQEIFEESKCQKCGCEDIRFVVRNVDENDFYELRCTNFKKGCGAKLQFGANKKGGGLFPKRKSADGEYLNDGGWVKWNKEAGKVE